MKRVPDRATLLQWEADLLQGDARQQAEAEGEAIRLGLEEMRRRRMSLAKLAQRGGAEGVAGRVALEETEELIAFLEAYERNEAASAKLREIFADVFAAVEARARVGTSKKSRYAGNAPPPRPDDASQDRMREDFEIAAKEAKAERTAAGRLANYQFLARTVDLENPTLALDEQRRRANRLLTAYGRAQEVNRGFTDSNIQLT